jgi:hypothetical protein
MPGVGFEVWSPERLAAGADGTPVGRGTQEVLPNCSMTLPDGTTGRCTTNDLTWVGGFGAPGTYHVRIFNDTDNPVTPQLIIGGEGLADCRTATPPQTLTTDLSGPFAVIQCGTPGQIASMTDTQAQPQAAPPAGPSAAAGSRTSTNNLSNALPIDGQQQTAAPNSETWHRFDYTATSDRTARTIRLANANNRGITFEVWTPETVGDTVNNNPIGRGSAQTVDCNSGVLSAAGGCQSNDLVWSGAFGTSGVYYVRVINNTNEQANYTIGIE